MAENCPPPGDSLPAVTIDSVAINPSGLEVEPGQERGVAIQVNLSTQHVVENLEEPSWFEDEILRKYLVLRVIQIRNARADKFLTGAMKQLAKIGLLDKTLSNERDIANRITTQDDLIYNNGLLDYAGIRLEHFDHQAHGWAGGLPEEELQKYNRVAERARELMAMMLPSVGQEPAVWERYGNLQYHRLISFPEFPPRQWENQEERTQRDRQQDQPFVDIYVPIGHHEDGAEIFGKMMYESLGVPVNFNPRSPYRQLGTDRISVIDDGNREVSSKGLVTIYDRPLVNNQGNLLLNNVETFREGNETRVMANLTPVEFGVPANVGPMGDKTLTASDISYLSYHAFFYVDINKMMEDIS